MNTDYYHLYFCTSVPKRIAISLYALTTEMMVLRRKNLVTDAW